MRTADIVICGAGITGVAAAYSLSRSGIKDIALVDERPPLSLTSDHSTECYRNWWPDPAMLGLMNHSIDLMEQLAHESGNIFRMNRRGYLYVTGDPAKIPPFIERATRISNLGAGELRIHTGDGAGYQHGSAEGYTDQPAGADLLLGSGLIRKHFPCITDAAVAALHVRRAGWVSAQQLGMLLLERAKEQGVQFVHDSVASVKVTEGRVREIRLSSGASIAASQFVNAAGPFLRDVGAMLGEDVPVHTELHMKASINDPHGVIQRNAPLLIWDDAQMLAWDDEERTVFAGSDETRWLTEKFPPGVHTRPEGSGTGQTILLLWEYKTHVVDPVFPLPLDDQYPEIALRGLTTLAPRMKEYLSHLPHAFVDGGYYTKTRENRPLIGRMKTDGSWILGAVSGYGIMSACGAADLLARQMTGASLPAYAEAFAPSRYRDPAYLKQLETMTETGQL